MTKKYVVASMSEREKTIVKMKASLYSFSIDELVTRSVNEFKGHVHNMDCSYCNEKTVVTRKKTKECSEVIKGKEQIINVLNYPLNVCQVCGAEFDHMNVAVYLKDLIRFEILKNLRERNPIPKDLDFNEIIQMHVEE